MWLGIQASSLVISTGTTSSTNGAATSSSSSSSSKSKKGKKNNYADDSETLRDEADAAAMASDALSSKSVSSSAAATSDDSNIVVDGVSTRVCKFEYIPSEEYDESRAEDDRQLALKAGDIVKLDMSQDDPNGDWFYGQNMRTKEKGWCPASFFQ